MILLEADAFGFIEQRSSNNPSAAAAIAASGIPALAGLPNTAGGFGLAFLQIRKSVGASNALLGINAPAPAFANLRSSDPEPQSDSAPAPDQPLPPPTPARSPIKAGGPA